MNVRDKAFLACEKYYRIDKRIKEITKELGNTFCKVPQCIGADEIHFLPDGDTLEYNHEIVSCLDRAYHPERYIHVPSIRRLTELCESCYTKHRLVQERKKLRQQLGAAKRWINKIGEEISNV